MTILETACRFETRAGGAPRYLHAFFEAQADAHPDHPAIRCGDSVLTYRELETQANRLAHHFRAVGIGPGKLVGLYHSRSPRQFIAILAALKAGAAYVPIQTGTPLERVRHIVEDARIVALVTESVHLDFARSCYKGAIIVLDRDTDLLAEQPDTRLGADRTGVGERDICYVIYTSGSTGRPKGVMIEHRSAVNFVNAIRQVYKIKQSDRVYHGFSIAFDAAVEEVWSAFSAGATLVIGPDEIVRSPADVAKYINLHRVTFYSTVPTFLAMIEDELPSVELLILGGEPCPPELVNRWACGSRRMLNTYGPTEVTVVTTWAHCVPGEPVTIGYPLPGYETYVLDENMRPVGPGVIGELYAGGDSVARGYVNLPDLTAQRFVRNPFDVTGRVPVLYRTFDLVRINEAGALEFIGRADGQVKIRGFRIELSEIEAVMLEHAAVKAAAVAVTRIGADQEIAAYVVEAPGRTLERTEITEFLAARLPEYMVPKYLDLLDALPLMPSGKVDRKALPQPLERDDITLTHSLSWRSSLRTLVG